MIQSKEINTKTLLPQFSLDFVLFLLHRSFLLYLQEANTVDKTILFFYLIITIAFATHSCPQYPYTDFIKAESYINPEKPVDNLLQYCSQTGIEFCTVTNILSNGSDAKNLSAEFIANNSFDNIRNWNNKIDFGKYPPTNSISSTNFKNAWVTIVYLDPSIYDNGTYIINENTKPLIRYNFTFVVDERPIGTDCKDDFYVCGYDYSVSATYQNNRIIANLKAHGEYLVDRYELTRHCNKYGCSYTCDFWKTERHIDNVSISDFKNITYEIFAPTSNYFVTANFNDLSEINLTINDSNIHFEIGNSSFDKISYKYKTRYEEEPYDILVKELVPIKQASSYGLSILDKTNSSYYVLTTYADNCSLTIYGHFSERIISGCNISSDMPPQIQKVEAKTPEFFYYLGSFASFGIGLHFLLQAGKKVNFNA